MRLVSILSTVLLAANLHAQELSHSARDIALYISENGIWSRPEYGFRVREAYGRSDGYQLIFRAYDKFPHGVMDSYDGMRVFFVKDGSVVRSIADLAADGIPDRSAGFKDDEEMHKAYQDALDSFGFLAHSRIS